MISERNLVILSSIHFSGAKLLVFAGVFFLAGSIHDALDAGFRHLDDAEAYGRSHLVGEVLHDWLAKTGVPREDWGSGSQNPWRIAANLGLFKLLFFYSISGVEFSEKIADIDITIFFNNPPQNGCKTYLFFRFQVSCLAFPLGRKRCVLYVRFAGTFSQLVFPGEASLPQCSLRFY